MNIKKNDTVKIIVGKDKGKTAKVLRVFPEKKKILIDGLNTYKKHVRPKKQGEKGQIILVPRSICVSNAMLVCSGCGNAVRIGYRLSGDKKERVCKKCKSLI